MDKEEIKKSIIEATFQSDRMKEYLIQNHSVSELQMLEILCGAPISLHSKRDFLQCLMAVMSDERDATVAQNRLNLLNDAINRLTLKQSEMFLLVNKWFNPVDGESSDKGIPCASLEDALEQIRRSREEDEIIYGEQETENNSLYDWFELCAWSREDNDQKHSHYAKGKYTYTIIGEDVCLFRLNDCDDHSLDYYPEISFERSTHLNLPIPYQVGDVVTIDCRPMGAKVHGVLLETGNNQGSCDVQVAYMVNDVIEVSALKHSHCFKDNYYSGISSLYRLDLYDGEMQEEKELMRISETLKRLPPDHREDFGAGLGYGCSFS